MKINHILIINTSSYLPVLDIEMIEDKLLNNMNVSWSFIQIINVVEVYFACFVCNPPRTSLVTQVVTPAPTSVNSSIRVDQESIAASASYQHYSSSVSSCVESTNSITEDKIYYFSLRIIICTCTHHSVWTALETVEPCSPSMLCWFPLSHTHSSSSPDPGQHISSENIFE